MFKIRRRVGVVARRLVDDVFGEIIPGDAEVITGYIGSNEFREDI